jgi:hypothetical protein
MFMAALFTMAKLWKQPRCPTIDEWIKEFCEIYTMEYYSAIRNTDMWFEGKWMQLEDIRLKLILDVYKMERKLGSGLTGTEKHIAVL